MSEVLVKLEVSQGRRLFGVIAIAGLGLILLYIAAAFPPSSILSLAFLVLIGGFFVWASYRLFRSSDNTILLTRETISTASGLVLCRLDQIAKVDRGFFAFKPSNGFLILLKEKGPRSWAPGMWWSFGKSIGLGGVTSPRQSKEMVSILQMLVAEMQQTDVDAD